MSDFSPQMGRCCSLIPGFDVKLSTTFLAGSIVLSGVGARPPYDGVHDADLLFGGMIPACGSANIPDCLFSALRYAPSRLSHRCSLTGYDEPAILSDAISSFCPTSADGLQCRLYKEGISPQHAQGKNGERAEQPKQREKLEKSLRSDEAQRWVHG